MTNWEKAYEDYAAGMKYKDIAEKHGVSVNTVKSWKARKWNNKKGATKREKRVQPKKLQPVINNDALNEQQKNVLSLLFTAL